MPVRDRGQSASIATDAAARRHALPDAPKLFTPLGALHAALHGARDLGHDTDFSTWPRQSGWWLAGREKTADFHDLENP